jgi:hypothetical protein
MSAICRHLCKRLWPNALEDDSWTTPPLEDARRRVPCSDLPRAYLGARGYVGGDCLSPIGVLATSLRRQGFSSGQTTVDSTVLPTKHRANVMQTRCNQRHDAVCTLFDAVCKPFGREDGTRVLRFGRGRSKRAVCGVQIVPFVAQNESYLFSRFQVALPEPDRRWGDQLSKFSSSPWRRQSSTPRWTISLARGGCQR